MFQFEVHPNISKVLYHYIKEGRLELNPITLPGHQRDANIENTGFTGSWDAHISSVANNEVVLHNDCLHKNAKRFEYLVVKDTDELIVPRTVSTWPEMMKLLPEGFASYSFQHLYFFDESQPQNVGI